MIPVVPMVAIGPQGSTVSASAAKRVLAPNSKAECLKRLSAVMIASGKGLAKVYCISLPLSRHITDTSPARAGAFQTIAIVRVSLTLSKPVARCTWRVSVSRRQKRSKSPEGDICNEKLSRQGAARLNLAIGEAVFSGSKRCSNNNVPLVRSVFVAFGRRGWAVLSSPRTLKKDANSSRRPSQAIRGASLMRGRPKVQQRRGNRLFCSSTLPRLALRRSLMLVYTRFHAKVE